MGRINNSILDISSICYCRRIIGIAGNGANQGTAKLCGDDLVAVGATAVRLMRMAPGRVEYLGKAKRLLENIIPENIMQIFENPGLFNKISMSYVRLII
jgi:uncharacterized protein (DUF362 family)